MGQVWDADVELSMAGAAALIERQFPSLKPVGIELIGQGWDNTAYLVNGEVVFRFPRRKFGAELVGNESSSLHVIGESVSLAVPKPEFIGEPGSEYPYPFMGYRLIKGEPACRVLWPEECRAEAAGPLAIFLAELHSIPVETSTREWAPVDHIRRADMPRRLPKTIERVKAIASSMTEHGIDTESLVEALESLKGTPLCEEPTCWVHGDFYPCHFLVDLAHVPTGVIDWGDVHLGDRSLDLSIAYTFLPSSARGKFWQAYEVQIGSKRPTLDQPARDRARFRALHYGIILFEYAMDVSSEHMLRTAIYALQSAMA